MKLIGPKSALIKRWRKRAADLRERATKYPGERSHGRLAEAEAYMLEQCANELELWEGETNEPRFQKD